LQYHGGSNTIENLRRLSGTAQTGTTLLGLCEASQKIGFDADGFEAEIQHLGEQTSPTILHVQLGDLQHYVVFYPSLSPENKHLIGDPARGLVHWTTEELEQNWKSRTCLVLKPNAEFMPTINQQQQKRAWLLNQIKPDFPLLLISGVLGVLIAALGMVMAVFSQKLIDEILPKHQTEKLLLSLILVAFLLLAKVGLSSLRSFFLIRQSRDFNFRIGTSFYDNLLHLPKPFFDTRKIGELIARLNDTRRIQLVISQLVGNFLIELLVLLVSFVFLFFYSPVLGGLAMGSLPLYAYLIYRHKKPILQAQQNIMNAYSQNESNYISTMQGISDIKTYQKQGFFSKINQQFYQHNLNTVFQIGRISIRLSTLIGIAEVLFVICILGIGSHQVLYKQIQLGEMMAVTSIASSLLPTITSLVLVAIPLQEAQVAFDRMFEFIGISPEKVGGKSEEIIFQKLRIEQLSFRFAGRKPILENLRFEINAGELVAIIGESGGGKSVFCQILAKFYEPEQGEITLNNSINFKHIDLSSWRKIVAFVPQQIHLFNGTVFDNICLENPQEHLEKVSVFCQKWGFDKYFDKFPQGIFTLVGEEGINLSGGQKQLLALARALYHRPQLLILDESTAALDQETEKFVLELIVQQKQAGTAIVFVTHRQYVLPKISDKVYELNEGKFVNRNNPTTSNAKNALRPS
jgi:ATP-binding cassette, subfamily C, bacteriocin exporter